MSLFPKGDILTKEEIVSQKSFVDSLSSKEEDRDLFNNILDDCYNYTAAINAKGQPFPAEPLIMALLLSQDKVINRLTELISKQKSLNNNKEVKHSKQQEQELRQRKCARLHQKE